MSYIFPIQNVLDLLSSPETPSCSYSTPRHTGRTSIDVDLEIAKKLQAQFDAEQATAAKEDEDKVDPNKIPTLKLKQCLPELPNIKTKGSIFKSNKRPLKQRNVSPRTIQTNVLNFKPVKVHSISDEENTPEEDITL